MFSPTFIFVGSAAILLVGARVFAAPATRPVTPDYAIDYDSKVGPKLQAKLEEIDVALRNRFDMKPEQTMLGVLDLAADPPRLAMIRQDHEEYAASVPKIGILLAYFETHPEAATKLDPAVRYRLGLMTKVSSNEEASRFSHELGLLNIQKILTDKYHFYDAAHGGGIWVGKHYGKDTERHMSPVGDNSHGATVRQLLRFWLLLEQEKLVSPEASRTMREIFASPDIPHDQNKFVKGLKDRPGVQIVRKSGTWEDWHHDTAVITGGGRHYILVAMTRHPKGDEYLEALAKDVDDVMTAGK